MYILEELSRCDDLPPCVTTPPRDADLGTAAEQELYAGDQKVPIALYQLEAFEHSAPST